MTSSGDADMLGNVPTFGDPSFAEVSTIASSGTPPQNLSQGSFESNQNGFHELLNEVHANEVGGGSTDERGQSHQAPSALERSRSHDGIMQDLNTAPSALVLRRRATTPRERTPTGFSGVIAALPTRPVMMTPVSIGDYASATQMDRNSNTRMPI
jgi:hypothetical protein